MAWHPPVHNETQKLQLFRLNGFKLDGWIILAKASTLVIFDRTFEIQFVKDRKKLEPNQIVPGSIFWKAWCDHHFSIMAALISSTPRVRTVSISLRKNRKEGEKNLDCEDRWTRMRKELLWKEIRSFRGRVVAEWSWALLKILRSWVQLLSELGTEFNWSW